MTNIKTSWDQSEGLHVTSERHHTSGNRLKEEDRRWLNNRSNTDKLLAIIVIIILGLAVILSGVTK